MAGYLVKHRGHFTFTKVLCCPVAIQIQARRHIVVSCAIAGLSRVGD
jgi:hypothetical protein